MQYWSRLSSNLRQAILQAHEFAALQGCPAISPAHLALGLLAVESGAAHHILARLGVNISALRAALFEIAARTADDNPPPPDDIQPDDSARRVLHATYIEARKHGAIPSPSEDTLVRTEHLLLGLLSPAADTGLVVFHHYGIFYAEVARIIRER